MTPASIILVALIGFIPLEAAAPDTPHETRVFAACDDDGMCLIPHSVLRRFIEMANKVGKNCT